ncbi:hypothetical protein CkaCkLH20_07395 [Colletotrichum karsti]|uniref:DUF8035 domain-containing protein n=1 Tax=Colletotrichum karsti TaxID=1095194 RepID=A0A9P6LGE6_9PEZI|nr:uncharacterized protein CkaCkLH20_07395 [Colletotrichum karsti]KAF9875129.1 hypothetical protein CkaCkLH20_07395 [Colletotrichum karsti]
MSAGTNVCSLQANLTETRRGGYQSYLIVLEPLDNVPTASIDVTDLVMLRERSSQVFHFYKEGQDVASKFDNLASTMFERRAYGDMKRQRRKILLQQMDALQQKMKDIKKEDNRLKDELQEHQQLLSHDSNELERLYMEQRGMLQRQSPLSQLLESIDISKTESLRRRMCHDLSLMLASEDPHIDSMSNEAEKLIMKAAFNGNVVALQLLCSLHGKSTDLSFEDGAGRAITNGRRQAVELLLEEASAVWLHDGTVPSALQYASKLSQTYSAVAGVAKEILDILLALPTPAQNQAGSAQTQALTGGELTIPTDQSLLSNEGPSSSQYPKKGKTRIPARLVSRRALIDLGYPHIEEGKTIIVLKALGQDNIDELLTLSEEYRMSEREQFQDSETSKPDAKDLSRPDDIETVVREAKQRFRDTLPKGYLSEEEYRLYERWYGPPLRETSPEDVGIEYLNEKVSEARVRHDGSSEPALLRQVEGGSYEEVSYVRKGVSQTPNEELGEIIEDNVTSEISTEVEPTEEVEPEERENYINIVARNKREYDALMKLQKDFEANARAFEESERAQALAEEQAQEEEDARDEDREFDEDEEDLDEMEDGIQDQGISNRAGRLHPLTRDGHFSTNPSTVALPYVGYISPVTTMLGRTDIKHVQEAAERAFGGPGLPYSPATPASKMNLPQQPVGMAVWQARMSEIDADAFVSTFLPPAYASAMGSLVEVRKRLGTEWLRKLFERGDGEGPRVLDVGAGGAGLLAWQDVTRAEWDAMKSRGEVTAKAPPGKQSVVIGAEKLRLRISKFLQNTTFLPRLPDYIHSFENQHLHVDANQTPQPRKMFDVIIASHLLLPVKEGHRRKAILNQLWSLLNPEGGVLIVLEKGQPRGFEAVAEVRDRLLDEFLIPPGGEGLKAEDEMETSAFIRVKEPGMIIAPCTNHKSCPMYLVPGRSKGRKDYCHFTQRFVRPPFLQKIMGATQRNHDDVQFSYVAIQRGVAAKEGEFAGDEATDRAFDGYENAETAPDMLSLPRQILPPIKRRGHVTLDVCTPSAHIERWTVPKSFSKQAYHDARKAKWGDLWALGAKTRMRRNVRLGKPEAEDDGGVRAQRAKEAARRSKKPVNVDLNEQGVVGDPDAIAKAAEPRRRKSSRQTARQDLNKRVQNDD